MGNEHARRQFSAKWPGSNRQASPSADVISIAEAIQKPFADAKAIAISSAEIEEETGSVRETVLDAGFIMTPAFLHRIGT
ncbi:hypothetical protein [Mesorhizobium sp. WSM3626]|uniref:hypothetical protein n=1 Tax=Mesorhizobium sp. WSM3626 TaxID=1040987 RepID=UPI0004B4D753|nr:hypothetical protein [Mesorhizobium sp. WSM3626]